LPEGIKVLDAGTRGLGLIDMMREAPKVIFIDAAEMGKTPGTMMRVTTDELKMVSGNVNFSLHEVKLPQVLHLASLLGICPEVVIFGIQPKDLGWGMELSPPLKRVVPSIVKSVLKEVDNVS
jgi:hydrogenase maturation protease